MENSKTPGPVTQAGIDYERQQAAQQAQPTWLEEFDPREQKSIDAARLYAAQYSHGDPGHLHLMVISKMAALLDRELLGIRVEYVVDRRLVDISQDTPQIIPPYTP